MAVKSFYVSVDPFTITDLEELETQEFNSFDELLGTVHQTDADLYIYDLDKLSNIIAQWFFDNGYKSVSSSEIGGFRNNMAENMTFSVTGDIDSSNTVLIRSRRNTKSRLRFYNIKKKFGGQKLKDIIKSTGETDEIEGMVLALLTAFEEGLTSATSGMDSLREMKACCFGGAKYGHVNFEKFFVPLAQEDHDFIMRSYQGGICFFKEENKCKVINQKGTSFDVNSMYPAIMAEEYLPYGKAVKFEGKYYDDGETPYIIYFQEMTIENLKLKPNGVPTLKKKNAFGYYTEAENINLVLNDIDIELLYDNYEVGTVQYHGGLMFRSRRRVFKPFVEKWADKKINAPTPCHKEHAKVMLNGGVGKLASRTDYKAWNYVKADKYVEHASRCDYLASKHSYSGKSVYSPAGAYITSLARKKLVGAIKANWDNFLYSDTDSIYILGEDVKGIELHDTKFGAWKKEEEFDKMYIIGKKQYVLADENDKVTKVTCAGMEEAMSKINSFEDFRIGKVFDFERDGYDKEARKIKIPDRYELKDEKIF